MGSNPGHAAKEHDHKDGDIPNDEFDAAGIGPIGQIGCPLLEARNHQAKARVAAIVGTTMASMMASEFIRIISRLAQ